jgi:hypothetical protein
VLIWNYFTFILYPKSEILLLGGDNMNEAPNVISTKDLLYIEDMMNWNYIFIKNLDLICELIDEEEICELVKRVRKMHLKHYKDLLNILQ